jgi:hypothetical protein
MRDGAFRPPVLLQEDLLPLSRMPRSLTSAYSNSGFTDFSRKMRSCGTAENTKEVKTTTLKSFVRPTAVYQIEKPSERPFEVKYVIQPTIKNSATSGIRTMDITNMHVGRPTKEISNNLLHTNAHSAISDVRYIDNNEFNPNRFLQDSLAHPVSSSVSSTRYNLLDNNELESGRFLQNPLTCYGTSNISAVGNITNNNELETGRFLQDPLSHHVASNISSKMNHTSIEDILDLADIPVHDDVLHFSIGAPLSGVEQTKYFHNDISLSRSLPNFNATTNMGDQKLYKRLEYDNQIELQRNMPSASCESNPKSYGYSDISSREAKLNPKINAGGYSIPAQIPMKERAHIYYPQQESEKARMNRVVMESMNGRFDKLNPFVDVR